MNQHKLVEVAALEVDCKIGKDRHFIAADRKNFWRIGFGLFAVVGSAVISSGIGEAMHKFVETYYAGTQFASEIFAILATLLPLLVGISTAIVGFLGLEKQTAQHRVVGNAYIEISRRARAIINSASSDPSSDNALLDQYNDLLERYLAANKEGESCPTNKKDSEAAMRMNASRRAAVKRKLADFDLGLLGISEPRSGGDVGISVLVGRAVRRHVLSMLFHVGLVTRVDARKHLRKIR